MKEQIRPILSQADEVNASLRCGPQAGNPLLKAISAAGDKRKNKKQKNKCIDRVQEPMRSFTINHWALLKEKHMFAVLAHASTCQVNYTVITQHTSLSSTEAQVKPCRCFPFAFCCSDKTMTKTNLEEGVYFSSQVESIMEGSQSRSSKQEPNQRLWKTVA